MECVYEKGDTPLLHPLPMVVVRSYCAVALLPHLCHGHNCGSANPPFKNPAYGPASDFVSLSLSLSVKYMCTPSVQYNVCVSCLLILYPSLFQPVKYMCTPSVQYNVCVSCLLILYPSLFLSVKYMCTPSVQYNVCVSCLLILYPSLSFYGCSVLYTSACFLCTLSQ